MRGNLFESALMKTSVISPEFRRRYLERPGHKDRFDARAIVFDGPEDYHARINDPSLDIDENCILVVRGAGPLGYPGSAEVVNMQPPDRLIKKGITTLPTLGDGRQSGTSASPSILNASPEAAAGGGLALLKTGDMVRIDLNARTVDMLVPEAELAKRKRDYKPPKLVSMTPWEEVFRSTAGQLSTGMCMELATHYHGAVKSIPRNSH
jgi:dihydroxy-acid dehydratase